MWDKPDSYAAAAVLCLFCLQGIDKSMWIGVIRGRM